MPDAPRANPRASSLQNPPTASAFLPRQPSDSANPLVSTYPWRCAPDDLATRRQLRRQGLRPGGQDVAGQILRPRRRREPLTAYLYRVDLAKPVRPMTAGRWRTHEAMMRPRRTCPACGEDVGYVIRPSIGTCEPCDPTRPAADQRHPAMRSS